MMHEISEEPHFFPVLMAMKRARVVVVGGGAVAERKVRSLLECGASVTVISPRLKEGLSRLATEKRFVHLERTYRPGDLDGAALAFVAIADTAAETAIAREAEDLNIPVNVVDQPDLCTFIVPAVVRRGRLTIAVSTGGASPAWSRHIKQRIAGIFGDEYAKFFDALAAVRLACLREIPDPARRRRVLQKLADDSLLELARSMDARSLETLLRERVRIWAEEDDAGNPA
jgi:precorrin-2 dehydrogenase/sirohydrochlorin ferrochelatase